MYCRSKKDILEKKDFNEKNKSTKLYNNAFTTKTSITNKTVN